LAEKEAAAVHDSVITSVLAVDFHGYRVRTCTKLGSSTRTGQYFAWLPQGKPPSRGLACHANGNEPAEKPRHL
jgi:hypothetical protein